jgi:serine/threonine-protein kinase
MLKAEQYQQVREWFDELYELEPETREARIRTLQAAPEAIVALRELLQMASSRGAITAPVNRQLEQVLHGDATPGQVIGAWRIEREIARGGMGRVYRVARDDGQFNMLAAMKLLRPLGGSELWHELLRERQTLAALRHPSIARLIDGGTLPSGQPWLVMELVEGMHVDRWCAARGLSAGGIAALMGKIASAVAYAHSKLVLHCDLKPSNILVNHDGHPVLVDFGIARLLGAGDQRGGDSVQAPSAHTPGFASPEHLRGEVSTASDLYSLGAVLKHLLEALPAEPELQAVVRKAMAPEPKHRYDSVSGLIAELERFVRGEALLAMPKSRRYLIGKWVRRNLLASIMASIAALALMVGLSASIAGYRSASRERDIALAALERASHEQAASDAVAKFISEDLLMAADLNQRGDAQSVTVLQAIEARAQNFGTSLSDQPDVEGRVRMAMGNVLKHLNAMDSAEQQLQRSYKLLLRAFGPEHERVLEAQNALAGVDLRVGNLRRAMTLYRDGYEHARKLLGPVHSLTLNFAGQRVLLSWLNQDIEAGIKLAESLLKLPMLKEGGSDRTRGIQIYNNLARLYSLQGRLDEAEQMHREVIDYRTRLVGENAFNTLEAWSALAEIYRRRGAFDKADAIYVRLLDRYRQGASSHAGIATMLFNQGRVLAAKGQHEQALSRFREAQAMSDQLFGADKIQSASISAQTGLSMLALGERELARERLTRADQIMAREWDEHHEQRQEIAKALARLSS